MTLKTCFRFYFLPFILWPFFAVLFIILLPVCLIVFIIRGTEYIIYRTLYDAELFPYDDIVWTLGKPENQLLINCCLIIDGVVTVNNFRKLIDETLIKFQDVEGNLLYWKVTKRIHPGCINYYWIDDEDFDIEEHVYELQTSRITCEKDLHAALSEHRSKELIFKKGGSPWEFVVIPYQVGDSPKTVIFARLSHAIADGSALAYFLINRLGKFEDEYQESTVLKFSQVRKGFTKVDRFLMNLKGLWVLPAAQATLLLASKDSNVLHVSKATGTKNITWTTPIDLSVVKSIKNRLGCTVNDVMLGCLAKTLSDFFVEIGSVCPSEVSVLFPLDVRSSPDEAKIFNNKLAVVIIQIPTKKTDLISLIQKTKHRMNYVKYSGEPIGVFIGWKFLSFLLPRFISKFFVYFLVNKTTGSVSNLVGPQQKITIGNRTLDTVVFWPPQTNHHCFGAAFCSYNGQIVMGVEGDQASLKDPQRIVTIFEENINKLTCVPKHEDDVKMEAALSKNNPAYEMAER